MELNRSLATVYDMSLSRTLYSKCTFAAILSQEFPSPRLEKRF